MEETEASNTQTIWVCVGTNTDGELSRPTWFYVFRSYEEADTFTDTVRDSIAWDIYPCDLLTVTESIDNVRSILNDEEK